MTRKAFFLSDFMHFLLPLSKQAGELIMRYYKTGHAVDRKDDKSPVTEADRAADRLIVNGLRGLAPKFPIVSEEGEQPEVAHAAYYWLVDPLDGTKSFIRGSGYFTVNIALIDGVTQLPVLGVIYEPVAQTLYWGSDEGAFRELKGKQAEHLPVMQPSRPNTAVISHSHVNEATEHYLMERNITERIACASSIKFCLLAEGSADIYPRFGATMEWDTAAGHAILLSAGGRMTTPDGSPFTYGKPGFRNGNFVASHVLK